MHQVLLYDTLTRALQPILPLDGKTVKMYTCGPTVYNFAHIGNFRTFLFEDLLRRTLLLCGYSIFQVMNLTDVDDKTIKGAKEQGVGLKEYTDTYKKAFFEDLQTLRIQKAEAYPEATAYIQQQIDMIQTLIEKKIAYVGSDKSVYFSIQAFPTYGKLSHLSMESLQQGASGKNIGDDYDKEAVSDFVLWKAYDEERDGQVFWDSPWGKGRPGWHIECSVMAKALLGNTIDIHAGGVDLIFPHHENEIAQSEGANGCPFAVHWAHADHLMVEGKKMSKRLHNFYTLRDLLQKGYRKEAIRFLLLSTHYRTSMNFTFEGLEGAFTSVRRLRDAFHRLREYTPPTASSYTTWIISHQNNFIESLSKDLAISEALASVFEFIRELNSRMDEKTLSQQEKESALQFFSSIDTILDILTEEKETLAPEIEALIQAREVARRSKNWKESDRIRDELKSKGYTIEDTAKGQKIVHVRN